MKSFYTQIVVDVEVEADTIEDAEQLVYEWLISDVDGNDYVHTDCPSPIIIMEKS